MNALQAALKLLAECKHPEDRRQYMRTGLSDLVFVRCSDCGCITEALGVPQWTRPALVARVIEVVQ